VDDPRRQKTQHECFVTNVNTVAGIVPALISGDDIKPVSEQIDNFSFTFVASLGADNHNDHINFSGL